MCQECGLMEPHPIRLVVEDDLQRSRLTVFFRLILAIPHFIWFFLWSIAVFLASILSWFIVLITARLPLELAPLRRGLHPLRDPPLRATSTSLRTSTRASWARRATTRSTSRSTAPARQSRWKTPRPADPGDPGRCFSPRALHRCPRRRRQRLPEQQRERGATGVVVVLRHGRRRRVHGVLRLVRLRRARPDAARLPRLRRLWPALLGPDRSATCSS